MTQNLWATFQDSVSRCQKCQLGRQVKKPPLGSGNPVAEILFVMDVAEEIHPVTGALLSGTSGKWMDDYLAIVNLNRSTDLYLTTTLKCYPLKQRPPLATEYRNCLDLLRQQVLLIKPKIIVCFGQDVATRLISPDFDLSEDHGTFVEKAGIQITGFYPFQEMLRNQSLKPVMLEDMKALEQKWLELSLKTSG